MTIYKKGDKSVRIISTSGDNYRYATICYKGRKVSKALKLHRRKTDAVKYARAYLK